MEVYFVRHGETVLNLMDKMQGWSDSPLTDKGIEDLKKTGQYLKNIKFDALYSSDLKRTMDTAEIIINENKVSNLKLQTSKNFREIFFGSFEGFNSADTWKVIAKPYGFSTQNELIKNYSIDFIRDAMRKADPLDFAEDAKTFRSRVMAGLDQLRDENEPDSKILVVTHGGIIKYLIMNYFGSKLDPYRAFPMNGSVTKVKLNSDDYEIEDFNLLP
ncbi:histidine phosphatase family protein [Companilactobacillus hulinensis]|uniref:histidine phosphatase family protein n=1 Tax=Companilactobacillus hulinensis TaxID=2486007 RepID=UPI000F785BFB|nr:histidine phosphatase family protein [Companilactobacillus hulinensis]